MQARTLIPLIALMAIARANAQTPAAPKPEAPTSSVIPKPEAATTTTVAPKPQAAPNPACQAWTGNARELHVAADQSVVTFLAAGKPCSLRVNDKGLRDTLKGLKDGDLVNLEGNKQDTAPELWNITPEYDGVVGKGQRTLWLLLAAALLATAIRLTVGKEWQNLLLGFDKRYSKSKTQMAAWFGLLVVTYIAAVILRFFSAGHFIGGVDIPNNLLLISGLSAFSFAGAKGLRVQKESQDPQPVNPKPPSFLHDLVYSDDPQNPLPDLGDFQMLVVTALAVTVYLVSAFHFLGSMPLRTTVSLPDVDTTILAAFGIGQGAYLAKKAVS